MAQGERPDGAPTNEHRGRVRRRIMLAVIAAASIATIAFVLYRGDEDASSMPDLPAACHQLHEGHDVLMWDSTMADEMLDNDCGWPYEPFDADAGGGEEDPALAAAAFEPRRYADLWQLLTSEVGGSCTVAFEPDGRDGTVFGFRYELAVDGCETAGGRLWVDASEHVTRATRDAAAHEEAEDAEAGARVAVLGRWVLTITGDDAGVTRALEVLEGEGAVPVAPSGG